MRRLMLVGLAACAPVLEDNTPYVDEARVLAVRVEPAEVIAGAEARLVALYADASGDLSEGEVDWSFCTVPKPLAELGPIARTCLDPASDGLASIGTGVDVVGTVPIDVCSLFGPNPPPPLDGQPAGRPTDPDVTGGYYQPAVGFAGDADPTLVSVRVRCGLANVSQEAYIAWNQAYLSNENPRVAGLVLDRASGPVVVGEDPVDVAPGEQLALVVAWPECPEVGMCGDGVCSSDEDVQGCAEDCTTLVGCGGAEHYVVYDGASGGLVPHREAISATWFITAGELVEARTGRASDDVVTTVDNTWTAPTEAGPVWGAVVLRDERGGVDFYRFRVNVTP